ncbi:MAG TPA: hypothetical protein DCO77_11950, partial [Nitrospiraceae bacterium]|nr:hypothetical protein [Nitrospiraceae bacterium]
WFLFIDGCIERTVEKTGTRIVGAQVDLADLDLTLMPLGIAMTGLQVTDKDAPMTNALEVGRIAFAIDSLNLLRRKVIINEMVVEGMRFSTPRRTSGAVVKEKKKKTATKDSIFSLPTVEIPSVKEILKKEKLTSIDEIKSVREDIKTANRTWKKRADELPDKNTAKGYRERIQKIRDAGGFRLKNLSKSMKEIRAIKRDVKRDLDLVKQVRREFSTETKDLRRRVRKAEKAPMNEVRRIRDKYSLSSKGLQNMTLLIFGGTINKWAGRGFDWYGKLKPALERSKKAKKEADVVKPVRARGVNVRFKEHEPLPDFFIRVVKASAQPESGTFSGRVRDITPDQDVLGRPTTLAFNGKNLKDMKSIKINGTFDHINAARARDSVTLRANQYAVRDLVLSGSDTLPITLKKGLADITVEGTYRKNIILATMVVDVSSARFDTGAKQASNSFVRAIGSALKNTKRFKLKATVKGTPDDYDLSIRSDLDKVLKNAVSGMVKEKSARLEKGLKEAILGKASGQLKKLKGDFKGLNDIGGKLSSAESDLKNLL